MVQLCSVFLFLSTLFATCGADQVRKTEMTKSLSYSNASVSPNADQTCANNADCTVVGTQTCCAGLCITTSNTCCVSTTCSSGPGTCISYSCPSGSSCDSATTCKSSSSCFAGSSEVTLENGDSKKISEVIIGDRVLSYRKGKSVYSDVVAIPHARNSDLSEFIQITTTSGKVIKATPQHLIKAGVCDSDMSLIPAIRVTDKDCVLTADGQETVMSSMNVMEEGLYTIVTNEEYLIVNGIVASPFAVNHAIPHFFYNFHRMLYKLMPQCLSTKMMTSVATVADEIAKQYSLYITESN